MRRRRRRHSHRLLYRRSNPLTTSEYVVGGLVAAAVLGVGGYLIYKNSSANALPAGLMSPGGVITLHRNKRRRRSDYQRLRDLGRLTYADAELGRSVATSGRKSLR